MKYCLVVRFEIVDLLLEEDTFVHRLDGCVTYPSIFPSA